MSDKRKKSLLCSELLKYSVYLLEESISLTGIIENKGGKVWRIWALELKGSPDNKYNRKLLVISGFGNTFDSMEKNESV